jgi:hypothetical protein
MMLCRSGSATLRQLFARKTEPSWTCTRQKAPWSTNLQPREGQLRKLKPRTYIASRHLITWGSSTRAWGDNRQQRHPSQRSRLWPCSAPQSSCSAGDGHHRKCLPEGCDRRSGDTSATARSPPGRAHLSPAQEVQDCRGAARCSACAAQGHAPCQRKLCSPKEATGVECPLGLGELNETEQPSR